MSDFHDVVEIFMVGVNKFLAPHVPIRVMCPKVRHDISDLIPKPGTAYARVRKRWSHIHELESSTYTSEARDHALFESAYTRVAFAS